MANEERKPHTSLSPITNIGLTIVWGAVAAALFFVVSPQLPIAIGFIGLVLGAVCGILQHLSIRQAISGFAGASSLLDVRRALTSNSWGRRYIAWFYFSHAALVISTVLLIQQPIMYILLGYLGGNMSLKFARELVTLRDTFQLQRYHQTKQNPEL